MRPLGNDVCPVKRDAVDEGGEEVGGFILEEADVGGDAGGAEFFEAFAGDGGERIDHGGDDAFHAGGDESIGAGGLLAEVAAGLECDVNGSAAGLGAGGGECVGFCVGFAVAAVVALADDAAIFDDDSADHWVGFNPALAAAGERECAAHETFILGGKSHAAIVRCGLALIQRDVVVRHGKDVGVDGGGENGADAFAVTFDGVPVGEIAFAFDAFHEVVADLGVPIGPDLAAAHVLGGRGIEVAVGEPLAVAGFLEEVGGAFFDHGVFVEAADLEGVDGGGGAGEAGAFVAGLVGETATAFVVAGFDIFDGAIDGLLGDVEAGVFGGAERDDLQHGDGDVSVFGLWGVAPAAFAVLRGDDEFDGRLEFFFDLGVVGLAVDFGEGDGGDAVAVHVGVFAAGVDVLAIDVAVGAGAAEEVVDAVGDVLAVFALAREMASGEEGHDGVTGHGDGMLAVACGPGAVGFLLRGHVLEGGLDDFFGFGIDDDAVLLFADERALGLRGLRVERRGGGRREQKGEADCSREFHAFTLAATVGVVLVGEVLEVLFDHGAVLFGVFLGFGLLDGVAVARGEGNEAGGAGHVGFAAGGGTGAGFVVLAIAEAFGHGIFVAHAGCHALAHAHALSLPLSLSLSLTLTLPLALSLALALTLALHAGLGHGDGGLGLGECGLGLGSGGGGCGRAAGGGCGGGVGECLRGLGHGIGGCTR